MTDRAGECPPAWCPAAMIFCAAVMAASVGSTWAASPVSWVARALRNRPSPDRGSWQLYACTVPLRVQCIARESGSVMLRTGLGGFLFRFPFAFPAPPSPPGGPCRSEEHTSELQSLRHLVC